MKKLLVLIAIITFCEFTFSQLDNKLMCRVNKIQGKEVYVMCEPVREYDVVDKVNSTVAQLLGVAPTLSNMVNTLVDKAVNKEQKGKVKPFDAIVTTDGNNAILIKFRDENTDKKCIATASKIQGKEVYILSEPLRDYSSVDKVNSAFAQIIGIDPTIDNMVKTMVDKAVNKEVDGKVGKFDAVLTSDGDVAILVKFN
jgi:hypothetical protein